MIEIRNVSFSYHSGDPVIAAASSVLDSGLHLLLGPNGCGKSTLLRLLAGIEIPHQGQILIGNHDLWADEIEARQRLAYVPETPDITPYARLDEVLALVAHLRGRPTDEAERLLDRLGMRPLCARSVRELSLGQRRRALVAAAMIGNPDHLLLDEPLDALDQTTRDAFFEWLEERLGAGNSVVLSSHELTPFAGMSSSVLLLRDARLDNVTTDRTFGEAELRAFARG